MAYIAASPGVLTMMQDAATTGAGTVVSVPSSIHNHIFYIRGNGAIGAGAITIETASDPDYTGTWSPLVNDKATPTTNPVVVAGTSEVTYTYIGSLLAVRARVSTTVTTTTATVKYFGT